jgi:two-component system cell cycle sensor histidine kinase PleC
MAEPCETAGQLAFPWPSLSTRQTCGEVSNWFQANPGTSAAAILDDDGSIVGIANRLIYLARYARQYAPELYSKKPVMVMASKDPLVVDENVPVSDLGATLLMENPNALIECFVVTRRGRYFGIVTGEALLRSKVKLAQDRETRLQEALQAARASAKAKGDFLALMSHELRTPLNAIIGFSEILGAEMLGPLGNARYLEYAHDVHGAGRHLLALINDILDLSKAEAGRFELNEEEVVPSDLVGECVKLMRVRAQEAGLGLSAQLAPGLPNIMVDRLRTKQILINLLSNAVKFTPAGGKVEISASAGAAGEFILVVRDTGIGMAPESIPEALEPFRQISSPFARKVEGTGLGLSLVKSLTECHGGRLEIESALKQGTLVRVILPAERTIRKRNALSA